MLSGGDHGEALVSPSICPQRNNLRTVSPAEAEPSPCTSGARRVSGQTVVCSPLPNLPDHAQLARAINGSAQWSHGQLTLLTKQHPNFSSNECSDRRHPLLTKLLTTSNSSNDTFPHPQQSKTTPRSAAETSTHSNRSTTMPPGSKRYLDDDQILELIEKKLTIFKGQMKEIKLNAVPMSTCSQSAPSKLDNHISKDLGVKTASDYGRHSPELLKMKSNGTATAKQTTEYVAIMQEAADICSKKEGECPVVLKAPGSSVTLEQFVKQKPSPTSHHTPSHQEYQSAWRNDLRIDEVKESDRHARNDVMKMVNNRPSVGDCSKLSESTPTSSTLEPSVKKTCPVAENTSESLPQSSDNYENERAHLNENSDLNTDRHAHKSSGTDGNVEMKHEPHAFIEQTQEKEVRTGESKMEGWMLERLKNPKYDDLTDDEEANLTPQNSTLDTSLQNKNIDQNNLPVQPIRHLANTAPTEKVDIDLYTIQSPKVSVPMQLEDITDDEGPVTGVGFIQVQTYRSPEQNLTMKGNCCTIVETGQTVKPSPKQHLACTCPIFVETEDGFEEGLCPKCQSEEDDEWLVVPFIILDVRLEQEFVVLDDIEDGNEENKKPSTLEQPNQPSLSCFQKLPEYDSWDSFIRSNKFNLSLPVVDVSAVHSELLPAPNNLPKLQAVEKATSVSATAPCAEAEDSCDTDDSSDYPLHPKRNRLTPSNLFCASGSAESEMPQPQETITPRLLSESVSSNTDFTHDEDSTNNAANNPSTVTGRLSNETSPIKETMTHHRKRKFKSRVVVSDSDDDDDFNQDKPSKYGRHSSSVSGQASTQHSQGREPSHQFCASDSAESEIPQPQETITPRLLSESVSSNTDFPHDEDSTNNAANNPSTVTGRLSNETSPIKETMTHHNKKKIKSRAFASDSVDDLNQDINPNHRRKSSTASGKASTQHDTQLTQKPGSTIKGQGSAPVSRKSSITTSTSEQRKEQGRQKPNEASMGVEQDMPEKPQSKGNAVSGIPNRNAHAQKNANNKTTQPFIKRSLSQPNKDLSTQSKASLPLSSQFVGSSLPGTLSLNGEQYQASSPAGNPSKPSIVKTNQVNSYSTDKPALKRIIVDWANGYVPTPAEIKRRRSCDKSARTTVTKKANGRDQEMKDHPARPRHNSHETPLSKKTKLAAKEWKQRTSRQPPNERNSEHPYKGYKWKEKTAKNDLDWERERESPELPKGLFEY